ncbi:hypothetical protein D3C77_456140 [compost metagenome]
MITVVAATTVTMAAVTVGTTVAGLVEAAVKALAGGQIQRMAESLKLLQLSSWRSM